MREIKFRAWDKDKGTLEKSIELFLGEGDCSNVNDVFTHPDRSSYIWMQYAGLKDKNGVEVYEGDIVKFRSYNDIVLAQVTFSDENRCAVFGWNLKSAEPNKAYDTFPSGEDLEVLGNIYETPNLLENK